MDSEKLGGWRDLIRDLEKPVNEASVEPDEYELEVNGQPVELDMDIQSAIAFSSEDDFGLVDRELQAMANGEHYILTNKNTGEVVAHDDADGHWYFGIDKPEPDYSDLDDELEDDDVDYEEPKPISDEEAARLGREFAMNAADTAVGGGDPIMMFIDDQLDGKGELWQYVEPFAKEELGVDDIGDWAEEVNATGGLTEDGLGGYHSDVYTDFDDFGDLDDIDHHPENGEYQREETPHEKQMRIDRASVDRRVHEAKDIKAAEKSLMEEFKQWKEEK